MKKEESALLVLRRTQRTTQQIVKVPIDKVHHSVEDCRTKASKDKESQAKAANGEAKVASELGVVFDYELIDNESGYAYTAQHPMSPNTSLIIDSGCSQAVTGDRSQLTNVQRLIGRETYTCTTADGKVICPITDYDHVFRPQ